MNHFRKRLITELSISLLLVVALFIGILFFMGNISDYADKIVAARLLLASRSASINELAELHSEYNSKTSNYMNVLYNIIPSYDQLINLSNDFQSLAAQNKVGFNFSFSGEIPKNAGGLGSIGFNLEASSDNFNSLTTFLKSLQNFRYLNSIDNISTRSNNSILVMSIKGRVFYR